MSMDVSIEYLNAQTERLELLTQQILSINEGILRLKADKADLEAEISHHHGDFKRIQEKLDIYFAEPSWYSADMALKEIRGIVG